MRRIKVLFMLLALWLTAPQAFAQQGVNVQDSLALVDLYNSTNGQDWSENSGWKHGPVNTWYGVTLTNDRVTKLYLYENRLSGAIPKSFGNLTNLQSLFLGFNQLSALPASFGNLTSLETLNLENNQFTSLPDSFSNLTSLDYLDLSGNKLSSLPTSFGNLVNLQGLSLGGNQLSALPASFGNLTKLQTLDLAYNDRLAFPESFGNLKSLQYLNLEYNGLSSLPESLVNLTRLQYLNLNENKLSYLPESFGNLTSLQTLNLENNQFSSLPESFGNLKSLQYLNLEYNGLSSLPESFGNLDSLTGLELSYNKFTFATLEWVVQRFPFTYYETQDAIELTRAGNTFIAPVGGTPNNNTFYWYRNDQLDTTIKKDSTYTPAKAGKYRVEAHNAILTQLILYSNTAVIQQAVNLNDSLALIDFYDSTNGPGWDDNSGWKKGPVSTWSGVVLTDDRVTALELSDNNLIGAIPESFGNLTNLQYLDFNSNFDYNYINQLTSLPASFGNLTNLQVLDFYGNQLTSLPASFGNLTNLQSLDLGNNNFTSLPASFGNLTNLQYLYLNYMQLSSLPASIGDLSKLQDLYLNGNQLSSLPASFGNLTNLQVLSLSDNQLNSLPESFGKLTNLEHLYLNDNKFTFTGLEWIIQNRYISDFYYTPQDTIKLTKKSNTLVAAAGGTPENNTLYWYRDYQLDTTIKADSTFKPLKPGRYWVEAKNAIATQLTLYSEWVDYLPDCDTCIWVWYRDADGDSWGNPNSTKEAKEHPKGYVTNDLDCNDKNKVKGGPEVCDGRDNDCDGVIDNGFELTLFYSDFDGDGYGTAKRSISTCSPPPRFVANDEDRNDDNPNVYPGAPEICDGHDNNQDGTIDEGFEKRTFYHDFDKDGYGRDEVTLQACAAPLNYVATGGDCNDRDKDVHPHGPALCDGKDNDCDGLIDEHCNNVVKQSLISEKGVAEQGLQLQLTATPNPASHYFALRISSNRLNVVQLRIVDEVGRIVEVKQGLAANSTVLLGHSYRPGLYIAEVLQEGKKVAVKLVKTVK